VIDAPWLRRPLTVTTWLLMSAGGLVLSPLLLVLAAIGGRLLRRPQLLIATKLLIAYFARELITLIACGGLWVLSLGGLLMHTRALQWLHWRLLRWFVRGLAALALSLLDVDMSSDSAPDATAALGADKPLLIFSRHAGPGDTVLLIDQLLSRYARRPSVVFKETLTLDPSIDLIAHRLPHAVLDTDDPEECEARIERTAEKVGSRGALVLFPEGGNFTAKRRRDALSSLRRRGRRRAAAKGEDLAHVLPPKVPGAQAALRGSPEADVIFAAHTGLGLAAFPRELWRELPTGKTLRTRAWLVPASERPTDPDEQVTWLFDWWKRIDQWIDEQGTEPDARTARAVATEPGARPAA
jgi:1-acyl-sn-glycerol-3-phosphate acyltransferase